MDETILIRALKALADKKRMRMAREIACAGELSCGQVKSHFHLSQPTISHHLKILADAHLIESRREGQFIRLKAVRKTLDEFRRALGHGFDGV